MRWIRSLPAALALLLVLAVAAPASAADWRGIIEGPYGLPWTHAERMRILAWMPSHGLTAYVHAPKDDLYERALWREPYPPSDLADFNQEIQLARATHVRWIPNISPAIPLLPTPLPAGVQPSDSVCFSCPADVQAVVARFAPFLDAGLRTVMVSFDDVSKKLVHPEDVAAFGNNPSSYGVANAAFLNSVYDALQARSPGTALLTVGADYAGTRDTPYLQGLRSALRPAVQVMWTGTRVRSTQWGPSDAAAYAALVGRRPIVWDNWTNNDFVANAESDGGSARLFLGPYTRPAAVARSVAGWFFNPASQADVNMLPLATAGDWLHNPWRYDAWRSWTKAVDELAGGDRLLRQALRAFAETSYSSRLSRVESPTFRRLTRVFLGAYDQGPFWGGALASLRGELTLAAHAPRVLATLGNRAFYQQARPFLGAAADSASAGLVATLLLEAERPSLAVVRTERGGFRLKAAAPVPGRAEMLRGLLAQWEERVQTSGLFVYGWRSVGGAQIPPGNRNIMDDFFGEVSRRDAAWEPLAGQAASAMALTVDGRPGPPLVGGEAGLSGRDCGQLVVARDGAGGQRSLRLPPCRGL